MRGSVRGERERARAGARRAAQTQRLAMGAKANANTNARTKAKAKAEFKPGGRTCRSRRRWFMKLEDRETRASAGSLACTGEGGKK